MPVDVTASHCPRCGFDGPLRFRRPGHVAWEIALWVPPLIFYYIISYPFLWLVAVAYSLYRHTRYVAVCPVCGFEDPTNPH